MKKVFLFLLCAALAFGVLAGCKTQSIAEPSAPALPAAAEALPASAQGIPARFTAENDIYTYRKLDPGKTTIVVARTGNIYPGPLCDAFEEANPDVQIVQIDITGGSAGTRPVTDWMKNGYAPDVLFVMTGILSDEETVEYLECLSANPVLENYQVEALNRESVDGDVYWLPGPSAINCLIYNKTLFAEYGWAPPKTFDEFVALCVRIREDTNGEIEPWNPNAKYSNEILTAMQGFTYAELFGGVENRTWYNEFCAGDASFAGHMEPMYDALQKLIDNGLLREEHFTYSATTRGKEFDAGKIAMINGEVRVYSTEHHEVGFMPFPGKTEDDAYVNDTFKCIVGIPKRERTEAEQDAVKRFIEFFSSVEGQETFTRQAIMVSNVKGVPLGTPEILAGLQQTIERGHTFRTLHFESPLGKCSFSVGGDALAMLRGEKTGEACIAKMDAEPFCPLEQQPVQEEIAVAAGSFSILETSFYMADMYREQAGAELGLIADGLAFRGNLMRIFAGGLTAGHVETLKPRSFENGSTLVKVTMTGRQLTDALNDPFGNEGTVNCIYAFSGLKCTVAPWNPLGEKLLSVTLADGTPIDENRLYTVGIWAGTIADEYITETVETFEGTWEAHMTQKLSTEGTIAPAADGRITLVWD